MFFLQLLLTFQINIDSSCPRYIQISLFIRVAGGVYGAIIAAIISVSLTKVIHDLGWIDPPSKKLSVTSSTKDMFYLKDCFKKEGDSEDELGWESHILVND